MAEERLNGTLQENLISLLAHSDEHGKVVVNLVEPELFEGEYRNIAERCVDYWAKYKQAPGVHTSDLFSDILEDKHNRKGKVYRRILEMMAELAPMVNSKYVLGQARAFKQGVEMKAAILESYEKIKAKNELAIGEIQDIWSNVLRSHPIEFEPGLRLLEIDRVLDWMALKSSEFVTGIPALDRRGVVPYRGALMMFMGVAKSGKSWWLIHLGKNALLQRKKVLHISLEMSEEECGQRYMQSLLSVNKRQADIVKAPQFKTRDGELININFSKVRPEFSFDSPDIKYELEVNLGALERKVNNLIIKRYPPYSLTPKALRGYLDSLEAMEGFIPDMLIVDYAGIMKTDPRNQRIDLGRNIAELRAIGVERNIAVCSAHQANRAGAEGSTVKAIHSGEDWSMVQIADMILTFSATDYEKELGLGRLYAEMIRDEKGNFGLILSQAYSIGQFCLNSVPLTSEYWEFIDDDDEEDEEEDEEEEGWGK